MCRGQYFHASPGFSALSLHCIIPCGESCLLGVFASFSKFSSKGVSFFVSLLLVVFWKECKDGGQRMQSASRTVTQCKLHTCTRKAWHIPSYIGLGNACSSIDCGAPSVPWHGIPQTGSHAVRAGLCWPTGSEWGHRSHLGCVKSVVLLEY